MEDKSSHLSMQGFTRCWWWRKLRPIHRSLVFW